MNNRNRTLMAFFIALALASLACELINSMTDPGPLRVESVTVEPEQGNGTFTASVGLTPHTDEGTLSCYIPNPADNTSKPVYEQKVPSLNTTRILTFEFTMTNPGSYTLYCTAVEIGISGKDSFTVIEPPSAPVVPVQTPSGAQPVTIRSTGQRTSLSTDGQYSCSVAVDVVLVVQADGTAEMSATGPGFSDHINCTQMEGLLQHTLTGTANPAGETVSFTSCNNGGFDAQGTVSYAGGKLSGEAACLWNRGDAAGKTDMRLTLP